MDRTAIFVDAGYLFAQTRGLISWSIIWQKKSRKETFRELPLSGQEVSAEFLLNLTASFLRAAERQRAAT